MSKSRPCFQCLTFETDDEQVNCCVLSHFIHVQFFVTLWIVAFQDPLSMVFSRQECLSELPCLPPGNLLNPGFEPTSLTSPELAGWFFTTGTTWEVLLSKCKQIHIKANRDITKYCKHREDSRCFQKGKNRSHKATRTRMTSIFSAPAL